MTARSLVVCMDGQSLATTPTGNGIAVQLHTLTKGRYPTAVVGTSGTTYADRQPTIATRYRGLLDSQMHTICVDIAGQSDLWADMTAATLLTTAQAYWTAARALGVDMVIAATVPPALNFALSAPQEAQRRAYNALLRARPSGVDDVVDLCGDGRFDDFDSAWSTLGWFSDGLHPTAAGALAWAEMLVPVLDRATGYR